MTGPQSLKEHWSTPERNRRHSPGRRDSDYAVCPYHEAEVKKAEKSKEHIYEKFKTAKQEHETDMASVFQRFNHLENRIVGKWAFGIVITILLALNTFMFHSIKADLNAHAEIWASGKAPPAK